MAGVRRGLDFADALHHASCRSARRWRRLMIAASAGASDSSISRHACLCRQVPERESGPLWLNQLGGRRRRPLLVILEADPGSILPVEPAVGAAGEQQPRRLGR